MLNVVSPLAERNIYKSKICYGFVVRVEEEKPGEAISRSYRGRTELKNDCTCVTGDPVVSRRQSRDWAVF